jgi:hypothetical protein
MRILGLAVLEQQVLKKWSNKFFKKIFFFGLESSLLTKYM